MTTAITYVTRLGAFHGSREVYRGPSLDAACAAMTCGECACDGSEVVAVGTRAQLRDEGAFVTNSGTMLIDAGFVGYVRCEVAS